MDTDNLPHMDKVLNFIKINESLDWIQNGNEL